MKVTLTLDESKDTIENQIMEAIRSTLDAALQRSVSGINTGLVNLIRYAITSSDAYQSLLNGKLKGELGLVNAVDNFNRILDVWAQSIQVKHIPLRLQGYNLIGGIDISAVKSDFSDILGQDYTEFTSEGAHRAVPGVNYLVEWFKYLALDGDKQINEFYAVTFNLKGSSRERSRTGMALMVRSKKGWRVPPEFSGTAEDNFVTKALSKTEKELAKLVEKEINDSLI